MKSITSVIALSVMSFFCCKVLCSQSIPEKLADVKNVDQAELFMEKNPTLKADLILLNAESDTAAAVKGVFNKKNQEVFTSGSYTCKIIEKKKALLFRASYIYLDGSKHSMKWIDSVRNVILDKYKKGISFDDLFAAYNMDGNKNGADLGYFEEGAMAIEFEDAVRARKKDEVFKVDVPKSNWYYVVKKTHENVFTNVVRILRVETP